MELNRFYLGNFSQSSTTMVASDPCYDEDTSTKIRGMIEGVKQGGWKAYVLKGELGGWGNRVYELQVFHECTSHEQGNSSTWVKAENFMVGVDSGQAGFFDRSKYPLADTGEYDDEGSFYGKVCKLTLGAPGAGIVEGFGAVSSSGMGDGGYDCFLMKNWNDEIIGAKIIFIDSDEENELTEGIEE